VTVLEIARVPVTDRTIVHVRFLVPGAGEELMVCFKQFEPFDLFIFVNRSSKRSVSPRANGDD
jgi:hypothetical protein